MKKLLIFTNLFWISVIVLFACIKPNQFNTQDCKVFCYDYSQEKFDGLTSFAAMNMAKNYQKVFTSANTQIMDTTETKSVWFSLETIKKFVYQIERSTCGLKCENTKKENLGIRLYFAKYPNQTDVAATDPAFSFLQNHPMYYGRKTLFMVPTYKVGLDNYDFDPKWSSNFDVTSCKPKTITEIIATTKGDELRVNSPIARMMTVLVPEEPDGMRNRGGICPPDNCNLSFQ